MAPPAFRSLLAAALLAAGAQGSQARDIHVIYMGGDDCPPCVAWRANELPQLRRAEVFPTVRFSQVTKSIRSAVPPSWMLPDEVKPYKDQLDHAGGRNIGSPQTAILVNGKVYDYFRGARSAADIEGMLAAIRDGTPYPYPRCVRRGERWACQDGG
ncbi:MAG TPA: hypothetical protein VEA35_04820 [Ramlibacter sp.]|nr:hypothetical protein [Ramlibacter sp.]